MWIGLGSNLGDRSAAINDAIEHLAALEHVCVAARSDVWETAPLGDVDQGLFLNAVIRVESAAAPSIMLRNCLQIETAMGRTRTDMQRWGPRFIDIDLLVHNSMVIDEPGLQLPHPRLPERAFVLAPFAQLDGAFVHPTLGHTINAMLEQEKSRNGPLKGRCDCVQV